MKPILEYSIDKSMVDDNDIKGGVWALCSARRKQTKNLQHGFESKNNDGVLLHHLTFSIWRAVLGRLLRSRL
jgi:hypothetical protein